MNKFQSEGNRIGSNYATLTVVHVDGPAAAQTYAQHIADRLNKYDSLKIHGAYYMEQYHAVKHHAQSLEQAHKLARVQAAGVALFVGTMLGMVITALMVAKGAV